jgi:hypothetical protein
MKLAPVTRIGPDATPTAAPSVTIGDAIYYRHKDHGVAHGTVAAVGRHGVTTDSEGEEHQVAWDQYLGHRQRATRRLTIVDRGEDGSIMEDEDGKRVYVRGSLTDYLPDPKDPKDPNEEPLAKADPDLLVKARAVRELAHAGFEPTPDSLHEVFGPQFVVRDDARQVAPDVAGLMDASLDRLVATMTAQFQAQAQILTAALAGMAERLTAADALQQTLLSVLAEARKPQSIEILLPDGFRAESPTIQIDNYLPETAAPMVHVDVAAPAVTVKAPTVHVAPPAVTVEAPAITLEMPTRNTVTEIERDKDGNIVRARQRETAPD